MNRRLATALPLALSACATGPLAEPVRSDGLARLGEATQIGDVVLTPQILLEDSRCPENARCIWAGRVIVRTRIDASEWRETIDLTLGEPITVRERRIALVSATPERKADRATDLDDYLFGFFAE